MANRNRIDTKGVLRYLLLFLILCRVIWWAYSLIPQLEPLPEVKAEPAIVHGGLPDPMSEINRIQGLATASDVTEMVTEEHYGNTEYDIGLLTRTLACESPNEPIKGIIAVAWVIRTRVEQKQLTYEQVITEPYQFSCFNSWIPLHLKQLRDGPQEVLSPSHYATLKWIAERVVSGELSNPLPGATHYYSSCLIHAPFWASKFEFLGQIGCHRFYKGEK